MVRDRRLYGKRPPSVRSPRRWMSYPDRSPAASPLAATMESNKLGGVSRSSRQRTTSKTWPFRLCRVCIICTCRIVKHRGFPLCAVFTPSESKMVVVERVHTCALWRSVAGTAVWRTIRLLDGQTSQGTKYKPMKRGRKLCSTDKEKAKLRRHVRCSESSAMRP